MTDCGSGYGTTNVLVIGGNMCRWPLAGKDAHPMRYVRTTVAPPRQRRSCPEWRMLIENGQHDPDPDTGKREAG